MDVTAIAIISFLVGVHGSNNECPKYLTLYRNEMKYRLVADGTESGFKTCNSDIANCVYTKGFKFYCMNRGGEYVMYVPVEVEASYENLKENLTQTSFGKTGGEILEIDLRATNNTAPSIQLYQMDVEVRYFCHCTSS